MGKSSDAPEPPDYAAAAEKTAAANRVNQITPYGRLTYTQAKDSKGKPIKDQWTATTTLSPAQRKLLYRQNKTSLGLGKTMDTGLGYVNDMLANPFSTQGMQSVSGPKTSVNSSDYAKMDAATVGGLEKVASALLKRMQPQLDRQRSTTQEALLMQGHNRGGQAWGATVDDLNRGENDARLGAIIQAGQEQSRLLGEQRAQRATQLQEDVSTGADRSRVFADQLALRGNQFNERGYLRNEPLNTLNAVRSGAQVTNPTFQNTPQGADYLSAAGMQSKDAMSAHSANQQGKSNMMSGLFSLGSAALMFSDRRLKSNIQRIGTHKRGIGLYSYEKFGMPEIGAMADEVLQVMPEAVQRHSSGFLMVDYGVLNG